VARSTRAIGRHVAACLRLVVAGVARIRRICRIDDASDRSALSPNDAYGRLLAHLRKLLRVVYEIVRFAVFAVVAWQLAERDASSGMWAFGDAARAAYLFVLLYALWPVVYNAVAWLIRPRRR
jgi:hypothetical protein